jgi:putative ABC transport system permease protein
MLLNASVSILISLDKPYEDFAKECEAPSAIIFPYADEDAEVIALGEHFKKLEQVERVEYKKSHYISEELTYQGEKLEGFFKLAEFNPGINSKVRFLEGNKELFEKLKADECILPACISTEYDIYTGDRISIKLPDENLIYTVKGVYTDPYSTSTAFDSDILIKNLPSVLNHKLHIILYAKDGFTGSQIEEAFRVQNAGEMNGEMQTLEDRISNGLLAGKVIGAVFLAIGVIMLLVSCLIINFMIRNAMITDAKTIAVYKTIGYTSGDILRIYTVFYFIVVTLACLIGIGSSIFISNMILSSVFRNMGQVAANNILLPGITCYVITVGLVIGIIYLIIGKTRKVKPVYTLNGMSESSTRKKKKYKGNSKIQFSAFGIALRTLLRNKKGAVSIVITAIITIFSVNFAVISLDVAATMKENNDYWLGVDKCDVMVGVSDSTKLKNVEEVINKDNRVDYYFKSRLGNRITMKWSKGVKTTSMDAFIYEDYSKAILPVTRGRNPSSPTEIAISSKITNELHKDVGDYIEVYLGGNKRVDLLITGIFQTYYQMGESCRVTSSLFEENGVAFKYDNYSIYLKNNKDIDSFMQDIKKEIGGNGNVIKRTEAFSSIMDMIVKPQQSAIPPVVVLVLLVGAINIFCIVMLKNANSEKTNGIYKCIGYTNSHLVISNLYYVGMVAAASIILSVPMILVFYPAIMRACLGMFGFLEYPVSYNLWHIALSNLGILALFIISTLVSSRSLKKVNVRDLVQE